VSDVKNSKSVNIWPSFWHFLATRMHYSCLRRCYVLLRG